MYTIIPHNFICIQIDEIFNQKMTCQRQTWVYYTGDTCYHSSYLCWLIVRGCRAHQWYDVCAENKAEGDRAQSCERMNGSGLSDQRHQPDQASLSQRRVPAQNKSFGIRMSSEMYR